MSPSANAFRRSVRRVGRKSAHPIFKVTPVSRHNSRTTVLSPRGTKKTLHTARPATHPGQATIRAKIRRADQVLISRWAPEVTDTDIRVASSQTVRKVTKTKSADFVLNNIGRFRLQLVSFQQSAKGHAAVSWSWVCASDLARAFTRSCKMNSQLGVTCGRAPVESRRD